MLFESEISGCGLKYRIDNVSIQPIFTQYRIVSNFAVLPTPTKPLQATLHSVYTV